MAGRHRLKSRRGVLVTVPADARRIAIAGVIERMPEHAVKLLHVTDEGRAAGYLLKVLRQ